MGMSTPCSNNLDSNWAEHLIIIDLMELSLMVDNSGLRAWDNHRPLAQWSFNPNKIPMRGHGSTWIFSSLRNSFMHNFSYKIALLLPVFNVKCVETFLTLNRSIEMLSDEWWKKSFYYLFLRLDSNDWDHCVSPHTGLKVPKNGIIAPKKG